MSKHETWRTSMYRKSVGGLLKVEFVAVFVGKNRTQLCQKQT